MNQINIDGVIIPFNDSWKKIAVSVSGGADSALLAFLLCNISKERNIPIEFHILSHTRMWKTKPWQEHDSANVFRWLVNKFPNIKFRRHTNFIAPDLEWGNKGPTLTDEYGKLVSGDNIEIRAFAEFVCCTEVIDAYFNAVTRNPRQVDFVGMHTRDIEPNDANRHLEIMEHMGFLACHPFRFTEKSWVMQQYKNFDIEDLKTLTRSCEGEFENINYKTYIPGQFVPVCGKCFWCKEREWANGQVK